MSDYSNISVSNTLVNVDSNTVSTAEDFKTINLLPEVFNSDKLKNFFDGTVEQVFSKPQSTKTTEYIGRKYGAYYQPLKDNYKIEKTKNRTNYQLETASVIKNASSKQTEDVVFYNELLDFVSTENGYINNQARLFAENFYAYGPPIDHDKFLNYENYYWYPSLDGNFTPIEVKGLVETITASSGGQTDFELSYAYNSNVDVVKLNGVVTSAFTAIGKTITMNSATTVGDVLEVTHNVDPDEILGQKYYTSPNGIVFSSGMMISFESTYYTTSSGYTANTRYYVEDAGTETGIKLIETTSETELFLGETFLEWDRADTVGLIDLVKGWDSERWDTIPDIATPDYITIQRGARDKNPWSRTNGWIHKDNVSETFQVNNSRKGRRPIIEFKKDIELYNYGINHIATVDLLSTEDNKIQIESQSTYTIDGVSLENGHTVLFVNSGFNTSLVPWDSNNNPWDHDVDNDVNTPTANTGGTGGDLGWDVTGSDFDVSSSIWQASNVGNANITLTKVSTLVKDQDKVTVRLGDQNGGKEYHWNGYSWILSQPKSGINTPPLYNLYDYNGYALTDNNEYPSSNFTGNQIFGYVVGTGTNDTVLNFAVDYDRFTGIGEINFKNYISDLNSTYGSTFYKQYTHPVILQKTFDKKILVQQSISQNRFYIDSIERQNIVVIKGNKYIFDLNDSSLVSTGYTGTSHPFAFSTTEDGSHNGGSVYSTNIKYFLDDVEVEATNFLNTSTFNSATKRRIEFTPDNSNPTELYYYCPNHSKMGGKIFVENNTITQLVDASTVEYLNSWVPSKTKSRQRIRQEFEVDNQSSANTFVLETIIADDSKVRLYVNSLEKQRNIDYTISNNQRIVTTDNLAVGSHVVVTWDTYENKNLKNAYYNPPKNLSHNPENNEIISHSYSDLLDHFGGHISNQDNISGLPLGNNTYRDTKKDLTSGDFILQHSSPLLKFSAHVNSPDRNLIKAIRFGQESYTRFKNKFLNKTEETINKIDTSSWTDSQLVDYVLKEINKNKKVSDNWSYSLMASYGDTKQTESITITAANKTWSNSAQATQQVQSYQSIHNTTGAAGLDIDFSFNPKDDKDIKSLYIYKNNSLMLMNKDYVIDNVVGTRIVFIGSTKPNIGDVITLEYYDDKQPAWIPATPSKLGMAKVYIPQQISDSSYSSGSVTFTQGHDGSLIPLYNDARDRSLLELEKRIYNDIENRFIDPDYLPPLSYDNLVSNYFNSKAYSYTEFNRVIRSHIYRWATFNEVDYVSNENYDSNDWKTWNWSEVLDVTGDNAPGHWRGIFKKFYGTDRPHTHPWEMLGFSIKPGWWDNNYSWTNTAKRLLMINDIEKGIIREGERANFANSAYADRNNFYRHEDFSDYVPVDTNGNIINPSLIGPTGSKLVVKEPNSVQRQKPWKIGDVSPGERAFYMNSSSPFALISSYSLMRPAEFYSLMFDTLNLTPVPVNKNIYFDNVTKLRHTNNVYVHRENKNNQIVGVLGYNHYVSERIIERNKNISTVYGGVIRNIKPQLAHKQGAFIDFDSYKVQAESYSPGTQSSSIFIPEENINQLTHISPAIKNFTYSGVIIERTISGYRVSGYDAQKNYFTTTISEKNGPSYNVRIGGEKIVVPTFIPSQTLKIGEYVKYEGVIYTVIKEHVTTNEFVAGNFRSVNEVPVEGGVAVTYYSTTMRNKTIDYEYGTEFDTEQEVFDFLVNYGRYLESQGWKFDEYNSDTNQTNDWLYSGKEFLFWCLGNWEIGSLLALSPSANKIKFYPAQGIVANVEDIVGSTYSILNKSGRAIEASTTTVIRKDNGVEITQDQLEPIYFVNLYTREIEHVTVFDNQTQFDDVIYNPTLSIRQPRLKQTVLKTTDWTGKLSTQGYLISTANGIISNFETSTQDVLKYLDIDSPISNDELKKAGLRTIGFSNREYLENLQIIDENQAKFYQGFVKQKGTINAIDRITRSDVVSGNQSLDVYEYYAFKMGEYGGTEVNESIEFKIDGNKVKTNPQMFQFVSSVDDAITEDVLTDDIITIDVDDTANWIKKPSGDKTNTQLWSTRSEQFELPTAGYVHSNDVSYKVFKRTDLEQHYQNNSNIALGSTYWIAKDTNLDWNVYRLSTIDQSIDSVVSINPLQVTLDETSGKLLTSNTDTHEVVIPRHQNNSANVITMTHGSKLLELSLSDQAVSKTINFSDFGGSNADVIADTLADKVSGVVIVDGGSGYSVNDTIDISGSGGTGASATVTSVKAEITGLTLNTNGSGYTTSSVINTTNPTGGVVQIGTVDSVYSTIDTVTINDGGEGYQVGQYVVTGNWDGNSANANVTWFVLGTVGSVDGVTGEILTLNTSTVNIGSVSLGTVVPTTAILDSSLSGLVIPTVSADITTNGTQGIIGSISLTSPNNIGDQSISNAQANISITIGSSATVTATGNSGVIDSVSLTSEGGAFYAEPADISIKTGSTDSAGSGAVIRARGNNPTYRIDAELSNPSQNFSVGETVSTGSGFTAKVTGVYKYSANSNVILFVDSNNQSASDNQTYTGLTSGATTTAVNTRTQMYDWIGNTYGDITFGGILTFKVNEGGANYKAPSLDITANTGVAYGSVEHSAGAVTHAYVTNPGYGYRKEFSTNADVQIEIKDTITQSDDATVTFGDSLIKPDSISNITVTLNESFDTSVGPQIDIDTGSNASPITTGDHISSNVVITSFTDVTSRDNTGIRLRFYGTAGTTGNATITINYKKATYNVKEMNGDNTVATAQDSTYMTSNTHPIWQYKDVRLATRNNGIDSGNIGTSFVDTVNDFVSNVCSSITFTEGDKIWLDNGSFGNWYTLTMTSNSDVVSAYNNMAVPIAIPSAVNIGSDYWIVHSDVNYNDVNSTVFQETLRTNKIKKQINSHLFTQSKMIDSDNYSRETPFEIFDPVKKLIPGVAQRELSYVAEGDPAIYTNHSDSNRLTVSDVWGETQVGQTWWDISTARYIEYENFDIQYRRDNWGRLFPNSTISVYEWTKSSQTPDNYAGDGQPINTSDYVSKTTIDKQGFESTKYYYWVKNKTTVPAVDWRSITTTAMARLIKNPTSYGINWLAPIYTNTLIVANSTQLITDESIFRLNYKTKDTTQQVHKQWLLLGENDPNVLVDQRLWNKLTDSLSGKDASGLSVPDTAILSEFNRYGNKVRPRQSWFKNVKEARRVFAYKANEILSNINLDISYPEWENGFVNSAIYDKVDYFVSGYNNSIVIDRTVETYTDIDTSVLNRNDVIKVKLDHNNKWALYIYGDREEILSGKASVATTTSNNETADGVNVSSGAYGQAVIQSSSGSNSSSQSYDLVRIANETSTMQLNSNFYTIDDVADDTRLLLSKMYSYLFVGERKINLNKLLFASINFVFTEQNNIDWVIKTSYFDIVQEELSLQQQINYQPDTFAYVKDYVNEVKPYHSKLLNYLSKKTTPIENANVSAIERPSLSYDETNGNVNGLINMTSTLVFDRVTANIELLDPATSNTVQQLTELKSLRTTSNIAQDGLSGNLSYGATNSSVERIAKYYFGSQLDSIDLNNDDQVTAYMDLIKKQIAPFKNLELNALDFRFDELVNSESVEDLGLDIIGYDDILMSWDSDAKQQWWTNYFSSANDWEANLTYTPSVSVNEQGTMSNVSLVKHSDLSHFDAWSTNSAYEVGDLVTYDGQLYICNVKHNAVDSGSTPYKTYTGDTNTGTIIDFSKWDLINDYVYVAQETHTANNFVTDYDAGKWKLVTTSFDGAGFVRPQHRDIPEELIPTSAKETLRITVVTYEYVDVDTSDIDSDGDTTEQHGYGDQYTFRIFYDNNGASDYKRLPQSFETTLTANVTAHSREIEVANSTVLYGTVNVPDPDDNSVTLETVEGFTVSDVNPGYIWVGTELIEFREVSGNKLRKIRRGVKGTTIQDHTSGDKVNSASAQHTIPNASQSAYWSAQDTAGTKLATDPTLDTTDQAVFIRLGGNSNFNLYDTTYVKPDYVIDQEDYFGEE